MSEFLTAALYKFVSLPDFEELREPIHTACESRQIRGMILLAEEGINGTIAGPPHAIREFLDWLKRDPRFADLEHKEATASKQPFYRLKIKLKREIVNLGVQVDPTHIVGTYVAPEDWNALISDPDVLVIDTRNDYEVEIGTFQGAVNPNTRSFSELPEWVEQASELQEKPKIAMFCTGGIRCEKSTAYLKSKGFDEVYHLQGGILKYLETIPEEESLWQGECFVFDERVSVGHGLVEGKFELCRACRYPISDSDKSSEHFELGVSCPRCHDTVTDEKKERLRERQRQIALARERNEPHIGRQFPSKTA